MHKFLFPSDYSTQRYSFILLLVRALFGIMLMTHGFQKISHFSTMVQSFPDPSGIMGSGLALTLAIFAELFCAAAFVIGFLYRLSMIPMIVTMAVAFFGVHGGSVSGGELAFLYLITFIIMYIAGPGRYSVDTYLFSSTPHRRR